MAGEGTENDPGVDLQLQLPADAELADTLSADELDRLRSLGYLR